ncbi:aspartate/glutamate racemase family protein [Paeniroseomonas aquatica]|uniref:Aspartate/glutamate racemase family protein n=1 Tax=Paeniroseomonas aquatica TaxID=373043 RepID=A0ABT8A5U9_9PROT|nr:aspartate/glutamate racemase family protein [Paeniroseomonas aquatica]MDN3565149.1 aspartate/glutamate racemase family protein [Paeniroseomonas aquatica]
MFMPPRAIGQLVPSSNRTVERTVEALLGGYPDWGACYARIPFHPDGSGQPAHGYDLPPIRAAVALLRDAGVAAISWNGTKGCSDGFQVDRDLGAAMGAVAGCPVVSVALDTLTILGRLGARRIGLVAPGSLPQAELSARQFGAQGVAVAAMRAFGVAGNPDTAALPPERIAAAARAVAPGVDAVLLWSTNLPGLPVVAALEAELGIPVVDSAAVGVWGCLAALGLPGGPAAALGGRMFGLLE